MDYYLGLGSNIPPQAYYIGQAISRLAQSLAVKVIRSPLYQSPAYVKPNSQLGHNSFLNCVVKLELSLIPQELLAKTQQIELELRLKLAADNNQQAKNAKNNSQFKPALSLKSREPSAAIAKCDCSSNKIWFDGLLI